MPADTCHQDSAGNGAKSRPVMAEASATRIPADCWSSAEAMDKANASSISNRYQAQPNQQREIPAPSRKRDDEHQPGKLIRGMWQRAGKSIASLTTDGAHQDASLKISEWRSSSAFRTNGDWLTAGAAEIATTRCLRLGAKPRNRWSRHTAPAWPDDIDRIEENARVASAAGMWFRGRISSLHSLERNPLRRRAEVNALSGAFT